MVEQSGSLLFVVVRSGGVQALNPLQAGVAQLVERQVSNLNVVGSNPSTRSISTLVYVLPVDKEGCPSWLGMGLQIPIRGFESPIFLHSVRSGSLISPVSYNKESNASINQYHKLLHT